MKNRIISVLFVLVVVTTLFPMSVSATAANGEWWELSEDGTLTISKAGAIPDFRPNGGYLPPWEDERMNIKKVVIQEGVTRIGDSSFNGYKNLSIIEIPDSVESIGGGAFRNCKDLVTVDIPESVIDIDSSSFSGCASLRRFEIDNKNPKYISVDGVIFSKNLTQLVCYPSGRIGPYTVPSNVSSIEVFAFWDCTGLTDLIITSNNIIDGKFPTLEGCVNLKSVNIPDNASHFQNRSFGGCSLTELILPNGITTIETGLFECCKSLTSILIPPSVTAIRSSAFSYCESLRNIVLPSGLKTIGVGTFRCCSALKSICIPDSVTSIEEMAFTGCPQIEDVYYSGTEDQWNQIHVGWYNECLTSARIHYNSTGPDKTTYAVTYLLDGGVGDVSAECYEAGETVVIISEKPTKDGYTFGGWSDGTTTYQPGDAFTMPDHDVTLTAVWRAESDYSVTYLLNGGTGDVPAAGYLAGQTVTITNKVPTKEGYVFDGWSDGSTIYQPGNTFEMPEHDVTLTAIWKEVPVLSDYSVTYRLNGGTGSVPAKGYLSGQTVTVITNIPTKEGYTFGGWSDGRTTYQPGDTFTMPGHDVTLTAVWKDFIGPPVPTFTVTYSLDGGVGNLPAEQHKLNETVVIPELAPKKEGYYFIGWSDDNVTHRPGRTFTMPNHDVKLVAIWTEDVELAYVQYLTKISLKNVDDESRESIQNALCNLLFKAQFRPTTGPKIDGIPVTFTGTFEENRKWPVQNKDSYASSVFDKVLGRIPIEGSAGCQAYASFGVSYTYGTSGVGTPCQNRSATGIKEFVHKWVDPGEHIRYTHSTNLHSIVFLGEDESGKGFYFISYEGGVGRNTTCHDLAVKYQTYEELAKKVTTNLNVRDANGGSYFEGTAKSVASIREKKREITRLVVRLACPVEATLTRNGETLDSRNPEVSTSFGSVSRIDDEIIFTLDFYEDYEMVISGTGKGAMIFTAEYYTDESLVDKRTFVQVPITSSTTVGASLFDPMASLVLHSTTNDEEGETTWGAGINEIIYGPNEDYSSLNNGPDTIINPPYISNYPSSSGGSSSSSGGSDGGVPSVYSISVGKTANGFVTVSPKPATAHSTVTVTIRPDSGYVLDTLAVTDKNGKDVKLTSKGTSKYTFIMPDSKVMVSASFRLDGRTVNSVFSDVPAGYWAKDAIDWASANGYMKGLTESVFNPERAATRQQVWMILARLNGQSPSGMAEARIWAMNSGLSDGTNPGAPVTRQQMVTFLHRYCGMMGYSSPANGNLTAFPDYRSVSNYAKDPLAWAVGNGVISGTKEGMLNPGRTATRAQFTVVLRRFYGII